MATQKPGRVAPGSNVGRANVGEVHGHVFVNNSRIGFCPGFVLQREERERALRSVVRRYFRLRMKVQMDQGEHVTPFLFVGNNQYQTAGLKIGTRLGTHGAAYPWPVRADCSGTLVGRETDQALNTLEVKEIWVQLELNESMYRWRVKSAS